METFCNNQVSENEIMKLNSKWRKAMKNQDTYAGRYTKYTLEKIMITVSNYN